MLLTPTPQRILWVNENNLFNTLLRLKTHQCFSFHISYFASCFSSGLGRLCDCAKEAKSCLCLFLHATKTYYCRITFLHTNGWIACFLLIEVLREFVGSRGRLKIHNLCTRTLLVFSNAFTCSVIANLASDEEKCFPNSDNYGEKLALRMKNCVKTDDVSYLAKGFCC